MTRRSHRAGGRATDREVGVVAAVLVAGSVKSSTAKRHLADLRARSGLTTEQLIYCGRAEGWLLIPTLEPG
jgi:hypothetical protein